MSVRLIAAGLVAVTLTFYAVNAFHYGNQPLRIEEGEWPPMAEAIAEKGKPIVAASETHRVRLTPTLGIDPSPMIGAWHPPLYQYALAATTVFVGMDGSNGLRLVGVMGLLASALLLVMIAREMTPRWRLIGGVAAGLLLIHPYAIQGSVFLDIDNTIYGPLALFVLWLAVRFGRRDVPLSVPQILLLGGSLALVTWAKMTTTIILVGVLVVWWVLARRPFHRAVAEAVGFVTMGAALFFSTYALWCKATGIPFSYTFDVTFAQKSGRLLADWWLTDNAAHWHLRWFGAAMLVLALVYLVDLIRNLAATRRLRELDLLFLFGVGVLFNYVVVSPTDGTYQGKYAFPAISALLLPVVWMLLRREGSEQADPARWVGAIAVGLVAVAAMPDLTTNLGVDGIYGNWSFDLLVLAGAVAAILAAWLLGGRTGFAGGVVVVLALLLIGQGIHSYRSDHSPLYPVDDTADFRAGVADLDASVARDEIVVAPKDLGFYVKGPVIEGEDAFARGDALLADAIRADDQIVAVVQNSFGPPMGAQTMTVVDTCFRDRKVFGSVTLAYRSGSCR